MYLYVHFIFILIADLILFVTSVDRPFTESERIFCTRVLAWKKKVLVVLNKFDLLNSEKDRATVIDYVKSNVREFLKFEPTVFPVSSRLAFQAKQKQSLQLWEESKFDVLQKFITTTLDDNAKIYLKLLNPIGVAECVMEKCNEAIRISNNCLQQDATAIKNYEEQLKLFEVVLNYTSFILY